LFFLGVLRRVGLGSFANPSAVFMRIASRLKPLAIAWAIAFHNLPEFIPVYLAEIIPVFQD